MIPYGKSKVIHIVISISIQYNLCFIIHFSMWTCKIWLSSFNWKINWIMCSLPSFLNCQISNEDQAGSCNCQHQRTGSDWFTPLSYSGSSCNPQPFPCATYSLQTHTKDIQTGAIRDGWESRGLWQDWITSGKFEILHIKLQDKGSLRMYWDGPLDFL